MDAMSRIGMILTEGEKMILTPTYHVFEMYTVHHDAQLLDTAMVTDKYCYDGMELDKVNTTVSKDENGKIHMTLVNIDPNENADVTCHIADFGKIRVDDGRVLTAEKMNEMNTFENPDMVKPELFQNYEVDGDTVRIHMPSKSVVVLTVTGE